MKVLARLTLVGVLAATPVALTATPASACGGTQCIVNCAVDLATKGYCRL